MTTNNTYLQNRIKENQQLNETAKSILNMREEQIREDLSLGNKSKITNLITKLHSYECNDLGVNTMIGKTIFFEAGIEIQNIMIDDRILRYNTLKNIEKLKTYINNHIDMYTYGEINNN